MISPHVFRDVPCDSIRIEGRHRLNSLLRAQLAAKRRMPVQTDASCVRHELYLDRVHRRLDLIRLPKRQPPAEAQIGLMVTCYAPSEISRCTGASKTSLCRIVERLRAEAQRFTPRNNK